MTKVFILVSFILGIIVGSLITYVIMGSFFSKAVSNLKTTINGGGHEESAASAEHSELLKSFDFAKNKVTIMLVGIMLVLLIMAAVVLITGKTITSPGQEQMAESLEGTHDIGALNSAIKHGSGAK